VAGYALHAAHNMTECLMDDTLRSQLRTLALSARRLLANETYGLLGALYGLSSTGHFAPVDSLPALQALPELAGTRSALERWMYEQCSSGQRAAEAVAHLVRETCFTHLIRLVTWKVMEASALLPSTLAGGHAAQAFLCYLADHPEDAARYHADATPQDARDEGPRDRAYRHFLLWQADQFAQAVPLLFAATSLPSQLFPRPRALHELLALLNAPALREAWAPGNEEVIGWLYQYLHEEEKGAVFTRLNKQKQKIRHEDLPVATQLFTPRWIVRFLVENSLGRHWLQMHPESSLAQKCSYLVPLVGVIPALPLKAVRELTLLDPACGTMHVGLVAFDLFAAMYREELEHAGEPGWPAHPSVASVEAIPDAILTHNLFGIDIDLHAVQLAALVLSLRARSLNPRASGSAPNLVWANTTLIDSGRLEEAIATIEPGQPQLGLAARALWLRLEQAGELGSLLRLEEQRRATEHLPSVALRARDLLNQAARQEAAHGEALRFVADSEHGFKLLQLLDRSYDLLVTNPPYMSVRGMPSTLAALLKQEYPEGKGDLYATFIQRCTELLAVDGRLGMITQQSFMFISSYRQLRERLLACAALETMAHVGPRAFAEIGGAKVNTTLFTLRREASEWHREQSIGTYVRLVHEPDARAKQRALEQAVAALRRGATAVGPLFRYRQGDFAALPGAPWLYWVTPGLRRLFTELPRLGSVAPPRQGLATADNRRFLRYWWEVGLSRLYRSAVDTDSAQRSQLRWFPYMKGGAPKRWWGNQDYCLNWMENGIEIKQLGIETGKATSRTQNSGDYFRPGVTYSFLTAGSFSARLSPGGFVFDVAGSSLFPPEQHMALVLALLNSAWATYARKLLNPTVNFQVGDLARLPIPTEGSLLLDGLVERAVALAREESREQETTYDFVAPPPWPNGGAVSLRRRAELATVEQAIDEEVYRLYAITGEDRAAIEAELSMAAGARSVKAGDEQPITDQLARRWLSYALGIALGRFQPGVEGGLGHGRFAPELAVRLQSLASADGMGMIEPDHPDDLGRRIAQLLELMVGAEEAHQLLARATNGMGLAAYLTGEWYQDHVSLYRKRPVYWLLQSPRRTVSLLCFHERLNGDSLQSLLGGRYLQGRINGLQSALGERHSTIGDDRAAVDQLLADAEEFTRRIRGVIERTNERGEQVGWCPEIDDGVLINLAPLHTLMPAWATEPEQCWWALERGDYDWSRTALRYWPERVLAACKRHRSYALAHGASNRS